MSLHTRVASDAHIHSQVSQKFSALASRANTFGALVSILDSWRTSLAMKEKNPTGTVRLREVVGLEEIEQASMEATKKNVDCKLPVMT